MRRFQIGCISLLLLLLMVVVVKIVVSACNCSVTAYAEKHMQLNE
jgi:hypothetical protein